jgi:hypothetical protein
MNSIHIDKYSPDKFTQSFCLYEIHLNLYKSLNTRGKFFNIS